MTFEALLQRIDSVRRKSGRGALYVLLALLSVPGSATSHVS